MVTSSTNTGKCVCSVRHSVFSLEIISACLTTSLTVQLYRDFFFDSRVFGHEDNYHSRKQTATIWMDFFRFSDLKIGEQTNTAKDKHLTASVNTCCKCLCILSVFMNKLCSEMKLYFKQAFQIKSLSCVNNLNKKYRFSYFKGVD